MILIVLFSFMLISFAALWIFTGGIQRIQRAAAAHSNPLSVIFGDGTSEGWSFSLPWQPQELSLGADISQYVGEYDPQAEQDGYAQYEGQMDENLMQLQERIDAVRDSIVDVKSYGDPSPYSDRVRIIARVSEARVSPDEEYVTIAAGHSNTAPMDITGWSLQSVLTGKIYLFPKASPLFVAGAVNAGSSVLLNPGATAIITSGSSPLGISFRENMCSGYLAQFQRFTPDIERLCPDPRDALPQTPENLRAYRASCFTYVQTIPRCRFPAGDPPPNVSPQCANFARNTYTYNGCVQQYQNRVDFYQDTWRLYLGSSRPLWNSEHDIVRLLDAHGRTVDILKY